MGPLPSQGGPPFETILWLNSDYPRNDAVWAAIKDLGFTAVTVSADEDPAIPGQHGLRFYRDQVAGKGILELRDGPWSLHQKAYERSRDPADLRRPNCLANPASLTELRSVLRTRMRAAAPHGPLAATLGDEISVTHHADPLDFCTSQFCLEAFRAFLTERHGDVASLNRAWGSSFRSMDDVVPFTADRIRAREFGQPEIPRNLRPWAEHLEFKDRQLADLLEGLGAMIEEIAPGTPYGLTGMQPPSAYGGHDYGLLMPGFSFWEAYDIGGARDLAMSLAPPGARQVTTIFAPDPGQPHWYVRARCFDALAHGMSGAIVWSARQVMGRNVEPTGYGEELRAAVDLLRGGASAAAGARLVRSSVWIVESQASVRAHWMMDSSGDGRTWIRRLSSYERDHSTSLAARHSWVRLFEDLGLQALLVPAQELRERLRRTPPKMLVLPALLAVSDEAVTAISEYVRAGGTVLADHGTGLYDEHLVRRDRPALDSLFGVQGRSPSTEHLLVRQGIPDERGRLSSGAAVAEVGVEGALAQPAGEHHVQIEQRAGSGLAVYLNLAVCEYGRVRLRPDRVDTAVDLRRRVRHFAWRAGLRPPVEVAGEGLPTCIERMELVARDGRRLLAVRLNALENPALARQLGKRGPVAVRLLFEAPVHLTELSTGRELGSGVEFDAELGPAVGLLYEVKAPR